MNSAEPATGPSCPILEEPRDGVPAVIDALPALQAARAALAAGTGPVAFDTERAHGFRYSPRAYLVQVRREGAGTFLIDPIAFAGTDDAAELEGLADDLADAEWVLHAASQDLPSLSELGLLPRRLFDTELAARLLGHPRVALASLLEEAFGLTLRKEHSAADWSRRPLPRDWLVYAALDVELLVDLRDWLQAKLIDTGKDEWAAQEFAHLVAHAGKPAILRIDPWRRTSGLHAVRTPRGLAVVRELWLARDAIAASLDRAPGRILPDRAITRLAALADGRDPVRLGREELAGVPEFAWRPAARYQANWLGALDRAALLTQGQLPAAQPALEGPPHPRAWERRSPESAKRWERVRPALLAHAEELALPVENLLSPDLVRRLAWEPPQPVTEASVDAFLAERGARPWQRQQTVPLLTGLL